MTIDNDYGNVIKRVSKKFIIFCENAVFLANGIEGIFVWSNFLLKNGCESAVFFGYRSEGAKK